MAEKFHVGTAGWNLRKEHQVDFDDGPSLLARYATRFNAVEINSSFYRPHRATTYARWAASVPDHFRFAVKVPRTITHEKRLNEAGPELERFMQECTRWAQSWVRCSFSCHPALLSTKELHGNS